MGRRLLTTAAAGAAACSIFLFSGALERQGIVAPVALACRPMVDYPAFQGRTTIPAPFVSRRYKLPRRSAAASSVSRFFGKAKRILVRPSSGRE